MASGPQKKEDAAGEDDEWVYYDQELSDFWAALHSSYYDLDPVDTWLSSAADAEDEDLFLEFWRLAVPRLLAPTAGRTSAEPQNWDEMKIEQALIASLEAYICGGRAKEKEVLKTLSEHGTPPALCGRIFKYGEPVFSCRDCGQDGTCVMCSECFQQSAHKKHRYRMSTSDGEGGYCDCGDHEAFLHDPICAKHKAMNVIQGTSKDALEKFPDDVRERARTLFHQICKYCLYVTCHKKKFTDLLVGEKEKETWPELRYCFKYSNYCLLLLNDDSHAESDVTNVLEACFESRLTTREASKLTSLIDKEGRAVLLVGAYKDCASLRDRLDAACRTNRMEMLLKTKILPSYVVAHQYYSMRLLKWMPKLFSKCSGFRALFSEVFFCSDEAKLIALEGDTDKMTIAEKVLTSELFFWKEIRRAWMNVIIEGVMKEYDSKVLFSQMFVRHYDTIMENFVRDDQEDDTTFVNLTVQFFTVKSIAHLLMTETDVFSKLVNMFRRRLIGHLGEPVKMRNDQFQAGLNLSLSTLMEEEKEEYSRYQGVLTDLMYLLRVPVEQDKFDDLVRENFANGTQSFLNLLSYLQFCDPIKRQTGQHVEYESVEWEYVGKMIASLASLTTMIHKWCARDKATLITVTNQVVKEIFKDEGPLHPKVFKLGSKEITYEITRKNVANSPVSVNVPFQRFLAGLIPSFSAFTPDFAENLARRLSSLGDPFHLVDGALTCIAALATMDAGMWRMNGTPPMGMSFLYHNFYLCPSLKRHDLIMLQAAACACDDPGRITVTLLERFRLDDWVAKRVERLKEAKDDDFVLKQVTLAESFLQLVLSCLLERHVHNIGLGVSERQELRHRLIQLLCAEAMAHSRVVEALEVGDEEIALVDEVLREVAQLEGVAGKRFYSVKREFLEQFNPFYYFYNIEHSSKALDRQLALKKKVGEKQLCAPPPLPPLTKVFERLPKLASSLPVQKAILAVLERACDTKKQSKFFTAKMVRQVSFLLIQGCRDDLSSKVESSSNVDGTIASKDAEFVTFVKEFKVVDLLRQMLTSQHEDLRTQDVRELLSYTLKCCKEALYVVFNEGESREGDAKAEEATNETDDAAAAALRKRRAEAAERRRHKLMAQMSHLQTKFARENADHLESMDTGSASTSSTDVAGFFGEGGSDGSQFAPENPRPVALGSQATAPVNKDSTRCYTCILCQADQVLSADATLDSLVSPAHISNSAVLRRGSFSPAQPQYLLDYLAPSLECVPTVTSCGHVMHARCYQNFMDDLVKKERRSFTLGHVMKNYDVNKNEYLCPICLRLSNSVLPLMPAVSNFLTELGAPNQNFYSWVQKTRNTVTKKSLEDRPLARGATGGDVSSDLPRLFLPGRSPNPRLRANTAASLKSPKLSKPVPESVANMASTFTLNLLSKTLSGGVMVEDYRLLQLCFQSCATSLHFSQAHRDGKSLLDERNNREADTLRSMVRLTVLHPLTADQTGSRRKEGPKPWMRYLRSNALYLLSCLLLNDQNTNFMNLDALNVMIVLHMATPALFFPEEDRAFALGRDSAHIMHLCLAFHLLQVLLGLKRDDKHHTKKASSEDSQKLELPPCQYSDCQAIERLWKQAVTVTGVCAFNPPDNLAPRVKHKLLRFLRCSALFHHFWSDIPLPKGSTYEELCAYLGLPQSIRDFLMMLGVQEVIEKLLPSGRSPKIFAPSLPPKIRRLISLPTEYMSVMEMGALFRCGNSVAGESKSPSLCLVCGEIVCSKSPCCETVIEGRTCGACTAHARTCSAEQGIFLRIRKCQVLLLSESKRGLMIPAPYVDDYGETDEGLRRGNPLKLDKDMYDELQRIWMTNGIPDKISRSFDEDVITRAVWHIL